MDGKNRNGTAGIYASICIAIAGILMIVVPPAVGMDGMNGGFALGVVGFFMVITGFISWLMMRKRFKIRRRMQKGDVIARFRYDGNEWNKMRHEEASEASGLKAAGIILAGIFEVIGIIALIADEELLLFLVIMTALAAVFVLVGFLSSAAHKRRISGSSPEAVITRDGVMYMGVLYDWNGKTSVLDAVGFNPSCNGLIFSYRQLTGRYPRMVRRNLVIPIPSGMEDTAALVVQIFNLPLSPEILRN